MKCFLFLTASLTLLPFVSHAEPTQTVSWFQAHPITRARVNELCADSPGEAKNNANCINAEMASEHVALNRIVNEIDHPVMKCVPSSPLMLMADRCTPIRQSR